MKKYLTSSVVALAAALAASTALAEVKIGAIFDLTGGLNIYGIQQDNALDLAVASGDLLVQIERRRANIAAGVRLK